MAAAFFDLDKTLCSLSSEKAFAKFLLKKRFLKLSQLIRIVWTYLLYDLNIIKNYEECKRRLLHSVTKGKSVSELNALMDEFYQTSVRPSIYPQMRTIVEEHKAQNRDIVIVSAAIELISGRVARDIGASALYGTKLEIKGEKYTGTVLGDIHYGATKARVIAGYCSEKGIDPQHCFAYGDHGKDSYMLSQVGIPVAVNPDAKLSEIANQNSWDIVKVSL